MSDPIRYYRKLNIDTVDGSKPDISNRPASIAPVWLPSPDYTKPPKLRYSVIYEFYLTPEEYEKATA